MVPVPRGIYRKVLFGPDPKGSLRAPVPAFGTARRARKVSFSARNGAPFVESPNIENASLNSKSR